MKNIDKLLKKKGWTGEEVGKALIASLLNDIKHKGQEHELLFSQADFDKMESSLETNRDYIAYGIYRDIYNAVIDTFNRGQGLYQQFYNGFYRYMMYLTGAYHADEVLANVEAYPLVMTEQQYKTLERETLEQKKNYKESFCSLFFLLFEYFFNALEDGHTEKIPAQILEAIENCKRVPATTETILSSYNEIMGNGYYQLDDGRRSDKMTEEEWDNAIKEIFSSKHGLIIDGEHDSFDDYFSMWEVENLNRCYKLFFNGIDAVRDEYRKITGKELSGIEEQDFLDALEEAIDDKGNIHYKENTFKDAISTILNDANYEGEWHYYDNPPDGLTQYDLLGAIIDKCNFLSTEAEEKAILKDIMTDFPALYKALETYIRDAVPSAKTLKTTQFYKDIIRWEELAELDIGRFREQVKPVPSDIVELLVERGECKFSDKQRILYKGIAIIQSPMKHQIDDNGNYKERKNNTLLDALDSIDSLSHRSYKRSELEDLQNVLIIPALKYLYSFNALVEILGEVYDIPDMDIAKFDTVSLERQLDSFNGLLYMLYFAVYGDKEEKNRKRKLIKELFNPVYYDQLRPSETAIDAIRIKLTELGISANTRKALKDFDGLLSELDNRKGAC